MRRQARMIQLTTRHQSHHLPPELLKAPTPILLELAKLQLMTAPIGCPSNSDLALGGQVAQEINDKVDHRARCRGGTV